MLRKIKLKIERFLYKKGFTEAPLRDIILGQLAFVAVAFLAGLAFLPLTGWFMAFFTGVALFALNLWQMSVYVLNRLPGTMPSTMIKGQLLRFFARFLFTGLVLTGALIMGGSPLALGLGVFSSLLVISIMALTRYTGRNS